MALGWIHVGLLLGYPSWDSPPQGLAQLAQGLAQGPTPRMGYLIWAQNPIVTLEPQTGVNVIWAHIPLQKGVPNRPSGSPI